MSTAQRSPQSVAIVGGGVIGGGWAARFLLNGWDVNVYDPDPDARRRTSEIIENAGDALPKLSGVSLPAPGTLSFADSLSDAVVGARWIQESVPENLELKKRVFNDIVGYAESGAIIASSTSGFKPSELNQDGSAERPIIVAHPFNPVYLLPLVELVTVPQDQTSVIADAKEILTALGMMPLHVRKEIDAHIADRLLEAVWREALWLVNDDIATTAEIDDAIRYGFGLRWAQMGLFETYRLAGGEDGMEHFIRQFGPALKWPWTKLMDVPDLSEELIAKIASQSDAQSGKYSIRELERIRDQNLVGFLKALKERRWGAGELLARHDEVTKKKLSTPVLPKSDNKQPLRMLDLEVLPAWIDYNGHMTEHRYLQVFAESSDHFLTMIGMDADYVAAGSSYYTVETHIMHIDESPVGRPIYTTLQVLHADEKRMHIFHRLHAGEDHQLLATGEQMLLHVDAAASKACTAKEPVRSNLFNIAELHKDLPQPEQAGRFVGQRKG